MSLLAKSIIKNKCWIVENDGKKVGSIFSDTAGVTLVRGKLRQRFSSLKELSNQFDMILDKTDLAKLTSEIRNIHGFPCEHKAHNRLWDLRHKLPIFTKTKKSKSFFCAGYYIIQFNNKWVKSYCPKLITLSRNSYQGPFVTQEQMITQLRIANGVSNGITTKSTPKKL